jgi:hypothetical protein
MQETIAQLEEALATAKALAAGQCCEGGTRRHRYADATEGRTGRSEEVGSPHEHAYIGGARVSLLPAYLPATLR